MTSESHPKAYETRGRPFLVKLSLKKRVKNAMSRPPTFYNSPSI